jgi:MoxR-like ATPase
MLGPVLRWNITSRSNLADGIYRYDALGRLHDSQLRRNGDVSAAPDDIGAYIHLGPLGTALLGSGSPRALLIDELDKSDLDLTSDLLHVLERGEFEIPELARHTQRSVEVRGADPDSTYTIDSGKIVCHEFPFIVLTSNGERDFPAPFLRRCLRFSMPDPDAASLARIVHAHISDLDDAGLATSHQLIAAFLAQLREGKLVATDQLLNAVYMLTRQAGPDEQSRQTVQNVLLQPLSAI